MPASPVATRSPRSIRPSDTAVTTPAVACSTRRRSSARS